MIKRMVIMLVLTGVVLGGVFGFQLFKASMIQKVMASLANPPQTVSTTVATAQDWRSTLEAVGSVRAVNGANLSAEVPGIVSALHFESGADVKAGDLLLELEASDDIAHLNALKATADLQRIVFERDSRLLKNQAIAQQQVDTDKSNLLSAESLADQQQALVDYKSVKAPFSGRLGIRQVDLGQYLPAGTPIVTLQQLDPIYVDFYVPQQALAAIRKGQPVTAKVDTFPDRSFKGEVSSINAQVDTATRTVQIRASVENKDFLLLPGMFATVDIETAAPQHYVTLPQTAIAYNSYGDIAYLVDDKGKDANGQPQLVARQAFVTTGPTRGDQVAILDGVKAGETVVTAGQLKLRNGTPVHVDNTVQPANEANPRPVDK
ncbi:MULTISPECIES: efflux RND transporter periplasmic adaptor subunit [Kaistia]|uniref:Efflux RND transporter periplasmic adaptor subunit n=1 Tax=Kaistia nematophila TaxID=2994654 RepID=A0A9X3E5J7_9HYPH|nr:efflux RND transporter periplasmic adaptor subunit [Kaistia nematophila]MBN9060161.1 efflux RND transporter periplasmic adaptor subunit [Hyphomicrobiales bacterium]MCX5571147.1 efflux RND transporter periplasmic adaptor subunit [Kaistia nematophila]